MLHEEIQEDKAIPQAVGENGGEQVLGACKHDSRTTPRKKRGRRR